MIFFALDSGLYIFFLVTERVPQSEQSASDDICGSSSVATRIGAKVNVAVVHK